MNPNSQNAAKRGKSYLACKNARVSLQEINGIRVRQYIDENRAKRLQENHK